MSLSPAQEQLLIDLVEAERRVTVRQFFCIVRPYGSPGVVLAHAGWLDQSREVFEGDIQEMLHSLLSPAPGGNGFCVNQRGYEAYAGLMANRGTAIERAAALPLHYLNGADFSRRHSEAFSKWSSAEALLWSADGDAAFTTIGHLTREAMQLFAGSVVAMAALESVPADPARTVARIRAVLQALAGRLGDTERPFLDALLAYWGTVSDLVQRQEHGAQREVAPLQWRDARRVVLQCAIVMFEIDEAVALAMAPRT